MQTLLRTLAVAVALAVLIPIPTSATTEISRPLLYAQQCVAEISLSFRTKVAKRAGLRQKKEECVLMWSILRGRAETAGTSEPFMIRKYNTLFKKKDPHRKYVLFLNASLEEPAHWPRKLAWQHYETTWSEIYEHAQRFDAGEIRHPCPRANQYGARCDDDEHACDEAPPCWQRQWCGRPQNWWSQAYWTERACKGPKRSGVIDAKIAAGL